jgi:hypothetical protein
MQRSIYADSARQGLKSWLDRKEGDWTCALALAAVKREGPEEWRLETATITPTDKWRDDVEEDCALLRRAIELYSQAEVEVVLDKDLTQFVNQHFAPGWMMVVFEHPKTVSIVVSTIPNDCGIEMLPLEQLYVEMLEGGIDALQNPDGRITPDQ